MSEYLSMDEACQMLGLDTDALLNLVQDNKLKGYRIDREMRFKEEDVRALTGAPADDLAFELVDEEPAPPAADAAIDDIVFEDDEPVNVDAAVAPTEEATVLEEAVELPTEEVDEFEPEETDRDRVARDALAGSVGGGIRRRVIEDERLVPLAPPMYNVLLIVAAVLVLPVAIILFSVTFYGITTADAVAPGELPTTGLAPEPPEKITPVFQSGWFEGIKNWVTGDAPLTINERTRELTLNPDDNELMGRPALNMTAGLPQTGAGAAPVGDTPEAPPAP